MLYINLSAKLLGVFVELIRPVERAQRLERARRLNSSAHFNPATMFQQQLEVRHTMPHIQAVIATPATNWLEALINTMKIETVEVGEMEARTIRSAHTISDHDKANRLVRAVLPTVYGQALKHADAFEGDLALAMSAMYAEGRLAVMRFDPVKANRSSFSEFVEDSLRTRTYALIDENANGGRKNREHEKALYSRLTELNMVDETDAEVIHAAFKDAYSLVDNDPDGRERLQACLTSVEKIQVILDMRVEFGFRGNFKSLDAVFDEDSDRTLLETVSLQDVSEEAVQQVEDEKEVKTVLEALEDSGLTLEEIESLQGKVNLFLAQAEERSAGYHDPKWGAVIAQTIGFDGYMAGIASELSEEMAIEANVAETLMVHVFPYYHGKLAELSA